MQTDRSFEEPLDSHAYEACLLDHTGDRLRWIKCPYGVCEVLIGVAIVSQACPDPRHQAVEVERIKKRKRGVGGWKHIQGDESTARFQYAKGLKEEDGQI